MSKVKGTIYVKHLSDKEAEKFKEEWDKAMLTQKHNVKIVDSPTEFTEIAWSKVGMPPKNPKQGCYKTGEDCKYNCDGICKESV